MLYEFNLTDPVFRIQKAPDIQATAPDSSYLRQFCRQSQGARCTVTGATHHQPPW